ncbi:hypothetical protein DYB25_007742 [Aphanomyces astaci]|nr:hypothetical protein DYB25_007742 [Aphanomyces astaci]RHY44521.1 hypothetical protein DYB30_004520 [Aphanomyces astaci]RHZ18400.1 hypothetical protein DYB26_014662 [Aphanomyces astaci]
MELVVFDPLTAKQRSRVLDFLRRMGYLPGTRADLVDKYLHNLKYDGLPTLNELSNTFKQCLGCTVYDVAPPFVVCVDCSRAPSRFDPRAGIRSSAGHTGSLPRSQAYKERSDVVAVCECPGRTPCAVCEGCDQCSCLCHTMFLTRYRLLRLGNNQNI